MNPASISVTSSYIKGKEAVSLIAGWRKIGKDNEILREMGICELEEKIYHEMSHRTETKGIILRWL